MDKSSPQDSTFSPRRRDTRVASTSLRNRKSGSSSNFGRRKQGVETSFASRSRLMNYDNCSVASISRQMSLIKNAQANNKEKEIPPSLKKIPTSVNKVLSNIPNLFVSNNQILELSAHLKLIKNMINRLEVDGITISQLQEKCTNEWNLFGQQMVEIVGIDENPNILNFCTRQVDSISLALQTIHTNEANLARNQKAKQQLVKIDEKMEEIKKNLSENLSGLANTLKSFQRIIMNSATVFELCTFSYQESQLYTNTVKQGISGMLQYIQNANEAVEARKYLQVFAYDIMKEIQDLFEAALKEEKKMKDVQAIDNCSVMSEDSKTTVSSQRKKPKKMLNSFPVPKHTPVSRPKLYEERRRVSAMGPLRAKVNSAPSAK